MFWGIRVVSFNIRSTQHQTFFLACLALSIWTFSFSIANSAPDFDTALFWRRVAALGWGGFFCFMLHFSLVLSEKDFILKKKWLYLLIYSPAIVNFFVFSLYTDIAVQQYQLVFTPAGWVNVAKTSLWDVFYQIYYVGFAVTSITLIWHWGETSEEPVKKIQSRLMVLSFMAALLAGTLTEYFINIYLPYKVPQLGPVFILLPVAVIFYCIRKYGFMAPRPKNPDVNGEHILSDAGRINLYRYLAQAYMMAAFINFAAQYFNGREAISTAMVFAFFILLLGLVLQTIQDLNISIKYKDFLSSAVMTVTIPLVTLRYLDKTGFYALTIPMILVIVSIVFNNRWVLTTVGASTIFTLTWMLFNSPTNIMVVEYSDQIIRIIIFGIFLGIAFYINHLYLSRLAEKERQVKYQKLISQISTHFVTANEKNLDEKLNELVALVAEFFEVDRVSLVMFFGNPNMPGQVYRWNRSDEMAPYAWNAAELPAWVDIGRLINDGVVSIPNAALLPDSHAGVAWLKSNRIKFFTIMPLVNKDIITGFLALDAAHVIKKWTSENLDLLNVITNLIRDIWLKVEAEREINYLVYFDILTTLPNRNLLKERMDEAIDMAKRTEKMIVVMFIDIDNLKVINDTMGHDGGDELLLQVSQRLAGCIRSYDTVARFGADEFIIIFPQVIRFEDVRQISNKVMNTFRQPVTIKNQEIFTTASAGISVFPMDGETSGELIKNADLAMTLAKEKGKNRYVLCTSELKKDFLKNIELSNNLYRALERNELELYYQPQVLTETGEIVGMEALIRWNHPQRGMISPAEFIPLAEKTGLISPIGDWVARTACRQNKIWQDMGLKPVRVAVNLSLGQFLNRKLVSNIAGILAETGLNPAYLELEVTESIAIHEPEVIINALNELKNLGVSLSIDDFGTEYSSLSRIKILPVDRIKIDVQFIRGITLGSKEESIVKIILQLAETLNLQVIAEGVETEEQMCILKEIKCDEIQGYYFYKPMPAARMEALLKKELS
ncbi:MAG: EAL domain-containing protein [Anaerolineae bacterium]|nr:EAL domain-containing protein [Anaerolineae bacterium]